MNISIQYVSYILYKMLCQNDNKLCFDVIGRQAVFRIQTVLYYWWKYWHLQDYTHAIISYKIYIQNSVFIVELFLTGVTILYQFGEYLLEVIKQNKRITKKARYNKKI